MARINLPSTDKLLVEGGDARILLDDSGFNRYYCKPAPDTDLVSLGSSTASVVSPSAFAAADRLRERLLLADEPSACDVYAGEFERIRSELLGIWGLSDLSGLALVFAASGTDLHLMVAQMLRPSLILLISRNETGSGVPNALRGLHFSAHTALGLQVKEGASVGEAEIEVRCIEIRGEEGQVRDAQEVDSEFERLARQAVSQGRRVLMIMVDQSKTGLIAPSLACVAKLQKEFSESIDVLVDACQFRISNETLRAYLQQGFWVALTGSKFLAGPTFSGALLIPSESAERFKKNPLPNALKAYSVRGDWPENWPVDSLKNKANFGLLLRWEAALAEQRAFSLLPKSEVFRFVKDFQKAVSDYLMENPNLRPLPVGAIDRSLWVRGESWDKVQTIFPFLLYHSGAGGKPLTMAETHRIYFLLQQSDNHCPKGIRYQLGQPVVCGLRDGVSVSALRLCLSARLIVEAISLRSGVIDKALKALDKTGEHLKKVF